jgi:hypothetical protein
MSAPGNTPIYSKVPSKHILRKHFKQEILAYMVEISAFLLTAQTISIAFAEVQVR